MKHNVALVSLAFVGCVFLFAGNAWAGREGRHGHHFDRRPHYGYGVKNHHAWDHHRGRHFKRFHHAPRHRGWHGRPVHRTVEKHVYHHYGRGRGYHGSDRYHGAGRLWEPGFSFSFGVSGTR